VRDQRHWWKFPKELSQCFPESKLYFIDFPGVGTEQQARAPRSIPETQEIVSSLFHARQNSGIYPKEGPWYLVAMSMGGMIGLEWLTKEPDLFSQAVIINSSAASHSYPWERFRLRLLPEILTALIRFKPEITEKIIVDATSNLGLHLRPEEKKEFLDACIQFEKNIPFTRVTFLNQILSASHFKLPVKKLIPLQKKITFITSKGDRLVSPHCSEKMAHAIGAPLIYNEWAGHDLPFDDPKWVASILHQLLKTKI